MADSKLTDRDIKEEVGLSGGTPDTEGHVVRGVKVLGPNSGNGRVYSERAMREGMHLYENAPVYFDHEQRKQGRKYADHFGHLKDITLQEGKGLFGDFHYNPKHEQTEKFLYDVQNSTPGVGFSHSVRVGTRFERGKQIVESIRKVASVDLVCQPATTSTIFENTKEPSMADETNEGRTDSTLLDCTAEEVKSERPSLYESIGKQWAEENMDRLGIEADRDVRHRIDILVQENDELRNEVTDIRRERQELNNRLLVDQMLVASGIPRNQITKLFTENLYENMNTHGPERVDAMIEDRRATSGRSQPISREQGTSHVPVLDGKSFVNSCRN